MILRALLPTACAMLLAPDALADKFYFGKAEEAAKMTEGEPDAVVGVLLKEEGDNYVIRIEGGEMTVAKSMVYKVENDGMTVADIENLENGSRALLAQADQRRNELMAAEAAATQAHRDAVMAAEAAMTEQTFQAEPAVIVAPQIPAFDPVLGVYQGSGFLTNYYIQSDFGGIIRRAQQGELRRWRRQKSQRIIVR